MSDREFDQEPTPEAMEPMGEEAAGPPEETPPEVEETIARTGESPAVEPIASAVSGREAARVEVHRVFVGTGLFWGLVLATVLTVIVIILAAQNIQQVTVKFLTFEGGAPLIAVLLASLLVGVILDEIVGWAYRARRRRILTEKEELKRLRAAQESAEE